MLHTDLMCHVTRYMIKDISFQIYQPFVFHPELRVGLDKLREPAINEADDIQLDHALECRS